jgi:DNA-binding FadR family transcriptional regulator
MNLVLAYISQSGLRDGDRLPPERQLAEALGISRRTLRQELLNLELAGLVWRGRRVGTVVGSRTVQSAPSIDLKLSKAAPVTIMECRMIVEPQVAALAAKRADQEDLAIIENCMIRTAEASSDDAWLQWDTSYHLAIARASRNDVLIAVVMAFNVARSKPNWRAIREEAITPEKRRRSVAHHRAIWEALVRRAPDEASIAMRNHIAGVKSNLFQ